MVCRPSQPVGSPATEVPSEQDLPQPGGLNPSRLSMATFDCLTLERSILRRDKFSSRVIQTIQASRRPSTNHMYNATWKSFCGWFDKAGADPMDVLIIQILEFLQSGLDKGLSPNTIRRQVAALSSVLTCGKLQYLNATS